MDVSEIKDRDSFKAWLEDKPEEWAQVLAARCAFRVAPMAFSVAALSDDILEKKHRENLTLLTFRANFISSADRKYPADDMRAFAAYAASAASAAASASAASAAFAAAASAAFAAAAYAADAAFAAFVADAAFAADAASASASAAFAAAAFWNAVRADCLWLADDLDLMSDDAKEPAEQAQNLMAQPLWLAQDEAGNFVQEHVPNALVNTFDAFQTSTLAQETSFGLIADWYIAAQEGKTAFNKKADLAIAFMSKQDWGDEDDERDCIAVMDRVAKLAGWGLGGDGVVGDGDLEQLPATVKTVWNDGKLGLDKTPVTSIHPDDVALDDLQSLIPEMKDLVDKLSALGNVDKMPAEYLAKTIELIPDSVPDRAQVFRLARRLAGLDDFKSIIADQCSDSIARLFNSIVDQFRQSLDQFSDRRSFNRKMLQLDFEELDNDEVKSDVEYQLDVMRSDKGAELIRDEVPDTIELIDNSEDGSIVGDNSVQKYKTVDQLESLSNILKSLAVHSKDEPKSKELFDKMIEAYDTNFEEGLVEGAAEAGKNDGRKAGKAITRTDKGIKLSKPLRRRLAQKYPKFFGWLDK